MWSLVVLLFGVSVASASNLALRELSNSINLFTPTIYKEIAKTEKKNFILSPLSAEIVLSLLQTGARGETAEELLTGLHLPNINEQFEATIKTGLLSLRHNRYEFRSASKLYLKPDFRINESFKRTATNTFQTETTNIDFTQAQRAAQTINKWVKEKTNNKIKKLVEASSLNNRTRLVLVNALYFKADWAHTFSPRRTTKANFYKYGNQVVQVDTMHNNYDFYNYFECPHLNAKFLEIPFKAPEASLTIILPNEINGIGGLESQIDYVFTPHNLTEERVVMAIPKFKIKSKTDFKKILTRLGLTKIFDDQEADLTGISGAKGDLIVDTIAQKSFIEVNEKGVEAAAATHASVAIPLMGYSDPPKKFQADHPFIWYIKINGLIVFAGRVAAPDE